MNILTFDIEEWFHILDNESTQSEHQWRSFERRLDENLERIMSILEQKDLKATFFCLGWVAREYPHLLRLIADSGHEIATHSDKHQLAYKQSPEEFRDDLKLSLRSLEDACGRKIRSYRAPGFSVTSENSWVFDILIEEGIEIDCSIFPASRAHGGFPSFGKEEPTLIKCDSGTIKEFPINTHKIAGKHIIFSGGGYFRLLPYKLIRYFANQSDYVMTYFHPRDFDAQQPMIEGLSALRRFKSYHGLKQASNKLQRFIDDFDFICLEEADTLVDWNTAPVCDLAKL